MKQDIHPKKNMFTVKCTTCNKKFNVSSSVKDFKADVCSNCHAFYVGKANAGSAAGRIEKFNKKFNRK